MGGKVMEQKEKEKNKGEQVAKTYGINLENMEQIKIKDKDFFKFVDPKDGTVKLIENINEEYNLSEQFKETQQSYSSMQNSSELDNAANIFEFEQKYNKKELSLISISELCYIENGMLKLNIKYKEVIDGLTTQQKFEVKQLLQVSEALQLKYINVENGIAIDNMNRVISATYNPSKQACDLNTATVLRFDNDKMNVNSAGYEVDLDSIDFDTIVEELEVSNDNPIEIAGEEIKKSELENYYNYPELVDRNQQISERKRSIITRLLVAYKKRKQMTKQQQLEKQKQKILFKNNSGFANELLFALIVGFASGGIFTTVLMIIKAYI